jgi:hypothetical protein
MSRGIVREAIKFFRYRYFFLGLNHFCDSSPFAIVLTAPLVRGSNAHLGSHPTQ